MTKVLSDHLSNPLQATPSDATNNAYNRIYHHAKQRPVFLSSEDELGQWSGQENYQQQVKSVQARYRQSSTPKHVDLDEDMSEDELAQPFNENCNTPRTTIDPRREFHTPKIWDAFLRFEESDFHDPVEEQPAVDEEKSFDQEEHINMDDLEEPGDAQDDEMEHQTDSLKYPLLSPFSSPQSSRHPSPDESKSLDSRSVEEQTEIQLEIKTLYNAVPKLKGQYQLLDRLGTGTFSSVYKAIDLLYDDWDNQPWLGNHPPESSAYYQSVGPAYKGRGGRGPRRRLADSSDDVDMEDANPKDGNVYVAVKRIHTTSGPDRIKNELSILETCRGCRHASQIITAFRNYDQVVIVLPYQRNMDFRDFYQSLHPEGIKCYFRCLFRALRDIHARGIIHRDVKPANFLYDPHTGIGTLCDFGLASRMESNDTISELGKCLHSAAEPTHPHGVVESINESQRSLIKTAQREARAKSNMPAEKVGYPEKDRRPVSKANRAGTRGFRAPEVLLKCHAQTGAIDVWSAGTIFLCFLTGKFPIFQSNDDVEALMEIASVLGKKKTERTATLHGRTFATNVPDLQQEGITWQEFVEKLNPDIATPRKYDMRYYPHNCKHRDGNKSSSSMPPPAPPTSSSPPPTSDLTSNPFSGAENVTSTISERYLNPPSLERHTRDMLNAIDLLEAMLHFESIKRIIPRDVLYHPFLSGPGVDPETEGDDEFVPHPLGMGVCRELHRVDQAVDEMYVEVWRRPEDVMSLDVEGEDEELDEEKEKGMLIERCGQTWVQDFVFCVPGQGIAIGNGPCEFHRDPRYICKFV